MIDEQPVSPELTALLDRVRRCHKRSRRAEKRLASASLELSDATAAGKAACEAVLAWHAANPQPQTEMHL